MISESEILYKNKFLQKNDLAQLNIHALLPWTPLKKKSGNFFVYNVCCIIFSGDLMHIWSNLSCGRFFKEFIVDEPLSRRQRAKKAICITVYTEVADNEVSIFVILNTVKPCLSRFNPRTVIKRDLSAIKIGPYENDRKIFTKLTEWKQWHGVLIHSIKWSWMPCTKC